MTGHLAVLAAGALSAVAAGALVTKRLWPALDHADPSATAFRRFDGVPDSVSEVRSTASEAGEAIVGVAAPRTEGWFLRIAPFAVRLSGNGPTSVGIWAIAVSLAVVAQRELTPLGAIGIAVALFGLASVLFLISADLIDRVGPLPDPTYQASDHLAKNNWGLQDRLLRRPTALRLVGSALIVGGIALVGITVFSVARTGTSSLGLPLWIASMILFAAGLCVLTRVPWRLPRSQDEWIELGVVLALMSVAFGFRFANLAAFPADVHGDEAAVGIEARRILTGEATNVFRLGWASLPELSFYVSSLTLRVFGNDLIGLRMASVIQGTLSVGLLYGVVRRLFSARLAFLSAAMLAVSQMAIHYARTGNNYVEALFASLLFFFFLLRGLTDDQLPDYLLAGFSAGFALSVYYPSRLILGIGFLYCVYRSLAERDFLRRHLVGLLVLLAGAGIFFAPQAVWYAMDPTSVLDRTSGVFVLSSTNLNHEYSGLGVHTVGDVLLRQLVNSLAAFNLRGETSMQYGQLAPLLDFWSGAVFVLGVVVATLRIRSPRYFLVASWFWLTMLTGSVLTVDAMFSPRMVAILAATAVLPALVLETGWRGAAAYFGVWGNRVGAVIAIVFLVVVAYSNYVDYFIVHAKSMEPANFFANLSRYVAPLNDRYRIYLLANNDTSLRYDTSRFLIPDVDGVDVRARPLPMPLDRIPAQKGLIFVDISQSDPRFKAIEAEYPKGVFESHSGTNGVVQFYSFQVEHADLVAANPQAVIDHAPIPALDLTDLPPPK